MKLCEFGIYILELSGSPKNMCAKFGAIWSKIRSALALFFLGQLILCNS